LGFRLVHKPKEDVPDVLESECSGFIVVILLPIDKGFNFESWFLYLRVFLVEVHFQIQKLFGEQFFLAFFYLRFNNIFIVGVDPFNLLLNVVFSQGGLCNIVNP
jgi:hypothetical protein